MKITKKEYEEALKIVGGFIEQEWKRIQRAAKKRQKKLNQQKQ